MVGVSTLVPIRTRRLAPASAPSQGSAAGACPPVCRNGWKWSEMATLSNPTRSAASAILEQLAGPELLRRGLVAERDHRPDSTLRAIDLCVLIPVKRLDDAKRRLAPVLGPAERRALMQSMIEHVAAVALEAGVGRVALASSDPVAVELAGRLGVGAVSDGGLPWNEGLVLARSELDVRSRRPCCTWPATCRC